MKTILQILLTILFALATFMASGNGTTVKSENENLQNDETTMISSSSSADNILNGEFAIQPTILLNSVERLRDRRRLYSFYNLCFSFVFTLGSLAVVLLVKFYSALLKKVIAEFVLDKNLSTQFVSRTQIHNTVLLI